MRLNCFLKAFISIPSPSSLLPLLPLLSTLSSPFLPLLSTKHYTYMMKRKIRVNTTAWSKKPTHVGQPLLSATFTNRPKRICTKRYMYGFATIKKMTVVYKVYFHFSALLNTCSGASSGAFWGSCSISIHDGYIFFVFSFLCFCFVFVFFFNASSIHQCVFSFPFGCSSVLK